MGSNYAKRYSDEYTHDAVELVRSSGRTVTEVAQELGISPESLRAWVRKDNAARGAGPASRAGRSGEVADDRDEELKQPWKLTVEQAKTIEILKRATAFFAKESDR
ncbi:transposase [Streptomyces sp. NPDC056480]|uniref:transposase n=1 Tax=Streptomyces sp. NPDC056480 TaxID=3345833 RepID=UPI003693E8B2